MGLTIVLRPMINHIVLLCCTSPSSKCSDRKLRQEKRRRAQRHVSTLASLLRNRHCIIVQPGRPYRLADRKRNHEKYACVDGRGECQEEDAEGADVHSPMDHDEWIHGRGGRCYYWNEDYDDCGVDCVYPAFWRVFSEFAYHVPTWVGCRL